MISDDNVVAYNVYSGYAEIIKRIAIISNSELLIESWIDYEYKLITKDNLLPFENEVLVKSYLREVCQNYFEENISDIYDSISTNWILRIICDVTLSYNDSDVKFDEKIRAINDVIDSYPHFKLCIADVVLALVMGNYFNEHIEIEYSDKPLQLLIPNDIILS